MANREALRELQGRLAQRLQAARTETRKASWLAIECAGHGLLVPLATAGEIFPVSLLLPVPHTNPWFLGVANLRGGLHGVVDLAAFLALRAPLPRDAVREQSRLLAFNPTLGSQSAVLVDRLAGLRSAAQLTAEPVDAQAGSASRPVFASARWLDEQGRVWQEIDLAALARHEQFLAIAA
ncbi:MAG: chemotaxis protein CheW [Rubrivivax sp.]|nr:chemotaxis protein CheW [Rubrivivax sp.]MDP3613032.1 chemotaxis protein CheW [Rubrivivax sp.]